MLFKQFIFNIFYFGKLASNFLLNLAILSVYQLQFLSYFRESMIQQNPQRSQQILEFKLHRHDPEVMTEGAYNQFRIPISVHQRMKKSTRSQVPNIQVQSKTKINIHQLLFKNLNKTKVIHDQLKKLCRLCQQEYLSSQLISIGECNHYFCKQCLHNYANYKINMFQEVYCPEEKCKETLSKNGVIYNLLENKKRRNYKKIHLYEKVKGSRNLRLCPNEKCEGVINNFSQNQQPIICQSCKTEFCPGCFLKYHKGACDRNQILFYEAGLHYRQCKKCKRVVEKVAGCDHIKCVCFHQFCYVCGIDWNENHICAKTPDFFYEYPCLRITIKIFYILGFAVFIMPLIVLSYLIQLIGIIFLSIVLGIIIAPFGFMAILCEIHPILVVLGLIGYPILAFVGIFVTFYYLITGMLKETFTFNNCCSVCIMISQLYYELSGSDLNGQVN